MNKKDREQLKKRLFEFMESFDDDELPDGAWQGMLMNAVDHFNESEGTKYDPHEMWLQYTQRKEKTR